MNRSWRSPLLLGLLIPLLAVAACAGSAPTAAPTPQPVHTEEPAPTETNTATPTETATPVGTPTPDPNVNPLTGLRVSDAEALRHRPILVRYGHDRQARPQSGLSSADLVYEELAEGGFITRITGAFLSEIPPVVGPVRSSRLAVMEMLHQLDAALVDAGASDGVLWHLSHLTRYPQYRHTGAPGSAFFFRSADKPSPHNLYIRLPEVRDHMIAEDLDTPVHAHDMVFAPEPPDGPQATEVHIPYPGQAPVDYRYDAASGTYLRFVEGAPHTDALNGQQIAPENVVVIYCEHKQTDIVEDKMGNVAIMVWWVDMGRAQVFRDGVLIEGRWHRPEAKDQMHFEDAEGGDVALKPGQTWIEIVPLDYEVTVR